MKPRSKKDAHLRRKFALEDEIPYEIERNARENKRIWKKKTSKLERHEGKQVIRKGLSNED